jgi:acetate---CoA ligase (ADP-forming)
MSLFGKKSELPMTLSRLLNPTSIAFIGGNECAIAIKRTLELGFTGKIWAVHPKREELSGIATVKSVEDIDGPIDAAFIAVKRETTVEVVRTLRKKNCGGAVIYAAGFAEAGATELQAEMLRAADGMPLLGPNCYGFVNSLSKAALWPDEHGIKAHEKGVAIITQSGNIACNFTFTLRALPLVAIFAIGNQADVDIARLLSALAEDPRITAIGLHIEGLKDISSFATAAEKCRVNRKPVIALKSGASEQGARTAMSHTSSLTGSDALYNALFLRHGIARMPGITAFAETLKFLHHGPLLGNTLVSLSCSGGEAGLAADLAMGRGVTFPPFNAATKSKTTATLNEFVAIDNPLDYHTFIWGDEEKLRNTFTAVLSGGFDCGMLILDFPPPHSDPTQWHKTARAFTAAAKANNARAAITSTLPECMPLELAEKLMADGIAPMMNLNDAITAFEAAAFIGLNWSLPRSPDRHPGKGRDPASPPTLHVEKSGNPSFAGMTEFEGKVLLGTFGLNVPKGMLCQPADAVNVANTLGYPIVLKISSAAIQHKTEVGGVALNLHNATEVEAAAIRLSKLGDEVLVERMVTGAVAELIIGLKRDPQFGLALVIGAGGVLTELLKDSATLLLPTDRTEIEAACRSLKCWKLIEGFRGKSGDQEAVFISIEAVASFAAAHGNDVSELDINPLLVLKQGTVAVDALITAG